MTGWSKYRNTCTIREKQISFSKVDPELSMTRNCRVHCTLFNVSLSLFCKMDLQCTYASVAKKHFRGSMPPTPLSRLVETWLDILFIPLNRDEVMPTYRTHTILYCYKMLTRSCSDCVKHVLLSKGYIFFYIKQTLFNVFFSFFIQTIIT